MRLRIVFGVVVMALLLVLVPYTVAFTPLHSWQYSPAEFQHIVKWAGCRAHVVLIDDRPAVGSFYAMAEPDPYLVIGTMEVGDIPYYAGLIVVLHETGHCLQHQAGAIYEMPTVTRELDADRYAADLACGLGLDGRRLLRDTFIWAHDTFDYEGDPWHGTLAERMAQGDNAHMCDKRTES